MFTYINTAYSEGTKSFYAKDPVPIAEPSKSVTSKAEDKSDRESIQGNY